MREKNGFKKTHEEKNAREKQAKITHEKKVRKKGQKSARKNQFSLSVKKRKEKHARKKLSERQKKKSDYLVKEHRINVQLRFHM